MELETQACHHAAEKYKSFAPSGDERVSWTQDTESGQSTPLSPPPTAVLAKEKWNQPRINTLRTLATFWSFLVLGANDAALGVSRACKIFAVLRECATRYSPWERRR